METARETFSKDDAHPIPDLDVVDIHCELKSGGHELVIVIASPLSADHRSQLRLREKIGRYLGFLASFGELPAGAEKRIVVKIHPASDSGIFDLLERCRLWVEDNHTSLEISRLPADP